MKMKKRHRHGLLPGHYTLTSLRKRSSAARDYCDRAERAGKLDTKTIARQVAAGTRSTLSDDEIRNVPLTRLCDDGIEFQAL